MEKGVVVLFDRSGHPGTYDIDWDDDCVETIDGGLQGTVWLVKLNDLPSHQEKKMTDIETGHHIKISDLIEALGDLLKNHGDCDVILSGDGEGNKFSPLAVDFSVGYYEPDSTWSGEFLDQAALSDPGYEFTPDDVAAIKANNVKAVVLWPVN